MGHRTQTQVTSDKVSKYPNYKPGSNYISSKMHLAEQISTIHFAKGFFGQNNSFLVTAVFYSPTTPVRELASWVHPSNLTFKLR